MNLIKHKGFTVIEVSILLIIFLIVAVLVVPLSLDDTMQAKNIARWRKVQYEFSNLLTSVQVYSNNNESDFETAFMNVLDNEIKSDISYRITYFNGFTSSGVYKFDKMSLTYGGATIAVSMFDEVQEGNLIGALLYDVNGKKGPNTWGKDVFGYEIYEDKLIPFGKMKSVDEQKKDCSRNGTGVYCSNYYLIGGKFDR